MDSSPKPDTRHLDREPRRGEVVLRRAAAAGIVGGALLGSLAMVPELIDYMNPPEWDVADPSGPEALLVGAFVGLLSAVAAAAGWLCTVEGPPPRPRASRSVAGLAAGGTIMVLAVLFGVAGSVTIAAFALVAGILAAALSPAVGYRARS